MQTAAVAWQVYLLTHSPVALGLMGLFRVAPIVLFSLIGGVVADVVNRRVLLLFTETLLLLTSAALAVATFAGVIMVEATKQIYAKPAPARLLRRRLVYAPAPHGL